MISVSRGRCGLQKTEKIFSADNEQGTIKRGEKWFPENFEKIDLENLKPLYTNKKVQLQLDFLISPAGRVLKILTMLLYEGIQE